MAKNQNIASEVEELLTPCIKELGYNLWDVEFVKEGASWYLRLTIDKEGDVFIEDCEKVSRAVDPILDEADPIENPYSLEVSSPGIERVLKKKWHFERCLGKKIDIKLFTPDNDGKKSYTGELLTCDDNGFTVKADENEKYFKYSEVAKVNLFFDFKDI